MLDHDEDYHVCTMTCSILHIIPYLIHRLRLSGRISCARGEFPRLPARLVRCYSALKVAPGLPYRRAYPALESRGYSETRLALMYAPQVGLLIKSEVKRAHKSSPFLLKRGLSAEACTDVLYILAAGPELRRSIKAAPNRPIRRFSSAAPYKQASAGPDS